MARAAKPAGHSLVASLKPLLRMRKAKISIGELLDRIEDDDGPGPVLFALTLPVLLSQRTVPRKDLVKLLHRVLPPLERFEKLSRPRLAFLTGRVGARLAGLACSLIALVLVLPIPFANLVPAMACGLFAMGLTRRDGLLILGGYALIIVAVVVVALGVYSLRIGLGLLHGLS